MMIKKNLMFFLSLSGIVFGLSACLGTGGNSSTYTSFAVIADDITVGTVMNTVEFGSIAAPGLTGISELKPGSCISVRYTIDFDNQPSSKYYTATDITYSLLSNAGAQIAGGDMLDTYNDSIREIAVYTHPYFNGNIFVSATRTVSDSQMCEFELICNPDSISGEVHTVFLKLHKTNTTSGSATNTHLTTFNLNNLFAVYGQDSIANKGTDYEVKLRYLPLNVKYQSGIKDGVPVYSHYGTKPSDFFIFR